MERTMNITGVIIGLSSFLIIGVFHPIVIKTEYHFGIRVWPVFLIAGIGLCVLSLLVSHTVISAIIGITGFSSLWSILELFHQKERVEKGWFPKNPKRTYS